MLKFYIATPINEQQCYVERQNIINFIWKSKSNLLYSTNTCE